MKTAVKRIAVFCGANTGLRPAFKDAATHLGQRLAARGLGLVYGGASIGLMGAVADGARSAGGDVIGVIPRALMAREIAHPHLADLRVVDSMHERKALMTELADGFIALPGGIGTLEEFFEVWTWAHLGLHAKPCALLNIDGFYDTLHAFIDHVDASGFLRGGVREMVLLDADADRLIDAMLAYRAAPTPAVLTRAQS